MPPEQEQCFACSGPDDFGFEVNDGTTPGLVWQRGPAYGVVRG